MPSVEELSSYEAIDPEESPPERRDSRLRPRRRGGAGVYVFAVLLTGAAVGLGAYAWRLLNETQKLKSDVAGLTESRDQAQQRVAKLVEENSQEQARSAQATTQRDQLQ